MSSSIFNEDYNDYIRQLNNSNHYYYIFQMIDCIDLPHPAPSNFRLSSTIRMSETIFVRRDEKFIVNY